MYIHHGIFITDTRIVIDGSIIATGQILRAEENNKYICIAVYTNRDSTFDLVVINKESRTKNISPCTLEHITSHFVANENVFCIAGDGHYYIYEMSDTTIDFSISYICHAWADYNDDGSVKKGHFSIADEKKDLNSIRSAVKTAFANSVDNPGAFYRPIKFEYTKPYPTNAATQHMSDIDIITTTEFL